MVTENFNTLADLYKRVLPALKSKVKELKQKQISYVTEKEVWDCLRKTKWNEENDLTLFDIVNDILFLEDKEIINYLNFIHRKKEEEKAEIEDQEIKETSKQNEEDTIL